MRKPWFWIVVLLAAIVSWMIWGIDWLAERRWQERVAEEKANGVKFTRAELRPARLPAEEDLSALPLFSELAGASRSPTRTLLAKFRRVMRGNQHGGDRTPAGVDWKFTRAEFLRNGHSVTNSDGSELDEMAAVLRQYGSIIQQLIRCKATGANWDEAWEAPPETCPPLLYDAFRCIELLEMQAQLSLAKRDPEMAANATKALMRFMQTGDQMPSWIGQFFRSYGSDAFRDLVWRGIEGNVWDDETLEHFAAACLDWNVIGAVAWSISMARASLHEVLDRSLEDPALMAGFLKGLKNRTPAWNQVLLDLRSSRRSWGRDNQLWIDQHLAEELAQFDAATEQIRVVPPRRFARANLAVKEGRGKLALADQVAAHIDHLWMHAGIVAVQIKLCALACGLELYRRKNGSYPRELEELVPAYLPRLPIDPYGGAAFRYRLRDDGTYLLYSVGSNFTDDECDPRHSGPDSGGLDWPWWRPLAAPARVP